MTKFTSTRDASVDEDGAAAVLGGFSADGGLYVPQTLPVLNYTDMLDMDFAARVGKTVSAFFDFGIKDRAQKGYADFDGDPLPTVKIDDNAFILELWHGKTHTSKDIPYTVLPHMIEAAKAKSGDTSTTLVTIATNGDMGTAAARAFAGVDGIELCVFYADGGMADLLKRELCSIDSPNVGIVGVSGGFDDIQSAVKSTYLSGLDAALADNNIKQASANSVNFAVIATQIACYFSAYCDLVNSEEIKAGQKIDFILPTGNFGVTIAGYYAAKMGLPVNKLVCVSEKNTALIDFIDSGVYDINRTVGKSKAPVLGNLERLIYEISGKNCGLTAERMAELAQSGRFSVTESEMDEVRRLFAGHCVDEDEVAYYTAEMFDEYGYVADARTAAAYAVAVHREFVRPTVIVSTVNPYKSAAAVMRSLGMRVPSDDLQLIKLMEEQTAMEAPQSLVDIFSTERVHGTVIAPQDIADYIKSRYCKK